VCGGFLAWTPASLPDSHFADGPLDWPPELAYRRVQVAPDLGMMCFSAGPATMSERRGTILFVHGFPETAASWKDYVVNFGDQGFYAVACDLRNVNNSLSSSGTSFSFDQMADDIKGIADSTGDAKTIVVGHDWGAAAVQAFSIKYPDSVSAMVLLGVPHIELYRWHNTIRLPIALQHVWYFLFFGLTGPVARWKAANEDFGWFISFLFGSANPKAFSKTQIEQLKDVYKRTIPDASNSVLTTWYSMGCAWLLKGIMPPGVFSGTSSSMWSPYTAITAPTLQLHGTKDPYVTADEMIDANPDQTVFFPNPKSKYKIYPDATHWINHEFKAEVIKDMSNFLDNVFGKYK